MPSAVVTVHWLQPPRYRGMEETVSRSRVRQRGHLNVGDEVRVRYKRSYYKAQIIDNGTSTTEDELPAQSDDEVLPVPAIPLHVQTQHQASSPDSPPRAIDRPTPAHFAQLASTPLAHAPVPRYADESRAALEVVLDPVPDFQFLRTSLSYDDVAHDVVLFPTQSTWELTTPSLAYSITDSIPAAVFDESLDDDVFDSDYDSEDPDWVPSFDSNRESDDVLRERAQRMIDRSIRSRPTTVPTPLSSHECDYEELLDEVVRTADISADFYGVSTLNGAQHLRVALPEFIQKIENEMLPMVNRVAEALLGFDRPCVRCLVKVYRASGRLESLRDNLTVFLSVAEGRINTAHEE